MEYKRLPVGCIPLDELLGGGLEYGIITEVYGEGGTGKTNICIQAAKNCAIQGKKVVFIDTETVSKDRLLQIWGYNKKIVKKILFFSPCSLKEQEEIVTKAVKIDAGLIIIDSANLYYRLEMDNDEGAATRSLGRQLVDLQMAARQKNIPILITCQVYSSGKDVKPFGGRTIEHMAKTIVKLDQIHKKRLDEKEERSATIIKHRSQHVGTQKSFLITLQGLE